MLRLTKPALNRIAAAVAIAAGVAAFAPSEAQAQGQGPSNWSGLYAGVHGGVGAGSVQGGSASGGLIGGQVGFNAQADRIVLGVEGDVTSSGFEHRGFNGGGQTFKQKWVGTLRGRVGYAADQVLIYGTAGGAAASNQLRDVSGKAEQRTVGWVVGAGAEARLTDRIGLRAEVLHYALGTATFNTPAAVYRADNRVNVMRAGVNYRF